MKDTNRSAIIFDFDGTMVMSFADALTIIYEVVHHKPLSHKDTSRLRGMTTMQLLRELHIPIWKLPFLLKRVRRALQSEVARMELVPGLAEIITLLSMDHKLFILSSNNTAIVQAALRRFGLEGCFSGVYGGVGFFGKSWVLRKLLREHSLSAGVSWYVGDQVRDIRAAHRVGMKAAAVTWGYSNIHALKVQDPEVLVFSPNELVSYVSVNQGPGK